MKNKSFLIKMVLTAILCVLAVIAKRFLSFNVWNLSIGVSFLPILVCAMINGRVWGGICGALADLIGAILFPFGPFFPGFTITAFVSGFLFGFIPSEAGNKRFFIATIPTLIAEGALCTVLLNSLWISVLYKSPFLPIVFTRLPLAAVMFIVELASAFIIKRHLIKPIKKLLGKVA